MNSVNDLALHVLVAQWIERPPGLREVMVLIPVFVPCSSHHDQFTSHISLSSLKFTILIHNFFKGKCPFVLTLEIEKYCYFCFLLCLQI